MVEKLGFCPQRRTLSLGIFETLITFAPCVLFKRLLSENRFWKNYFSVVPLSQNWFFSDVDPCEYVNW